MCEYWRSGNNSEKKTSPLAGVSIGGVAKLSGPFFKRDVCSVTHTPEMLAGRVKKRGSLSHRWLASLLVTRLSHTRT